MDEFIANKILFSQLKSGKSMDITVTGISMNPTFYEGDRITVRRQDKYTPGDILVFTYKYDHLLVHRLLKVKNGTYYCKGDNSNRLEDITPRQIAGKVTHLNGHKLPPCPSDLIILSYLVNRKFIRSGYRTDITTASEIYHLYHNYIYKKEIIPMKYKKNDAMEYIQAEDSTLVVFDPDTGDTHLFDETGTDILNCMDEPCSVDELLGKLSAIYDIGQEDIRADVEDFLTETVSKKIIEIVCG